MQNASLPVHSYRWSWTVLVISDDIGFAITTCHFILSTVLAWFDLSAPFHHLTYHHSSYFFLIWLFFSFLTSLLFYSTHLVEVYKDVHRRSELIGWADSQSASKERAAQNPSRQEGTGKTMCRPWRVFVIRCRVDLKFCECPVVTPLMESVVALWEIFVSLSPSTLTLVLIFFAKYFNLMPASKDCA